MSLYRNRDRSRIFLRRGALVRNGMTDWSEGFISEGATPTFSS